MKVSDYYSFRISHDEFYGLSSIHGGVTLQEEWKRKIEEAGGQVHAKIKKGLFLLPWILNQTCSSSYMVYCCIYSVSCYLKRHIADTNCLIVGGELENQDAEMRKAR